MFGFSRNREIASAQLSLWSLEDPAQDWTVRESARARRLTVRVFRTGRVEVVVPRRTSRQALERFLDKHRDWIETRRREARRAATPPEAFPPAAIEFAATNERWRLHFAGGKERLAISGAPQSQAALAARCPPNSEEQHPPGAPGLLTIAGNAADAGALRRELRRWLADQAARILAPQLQSVARELGFTYKRMIVRRQRTRWGSCSSRGTISLNCCVLFQSPEVARYLLIHELAHTRHMNHSRRFWDCVARCSPDYRRLDRELERGWRRVPAWVFDS